MVLQSRHPVRAHVKLAFLCHESQFHFLLLWNAVSTRHLDLPRKIFRKYACIGFKALSTTFPLIPGECLYGTLLYTPSPTPNLWCRMNIKWSRIMRMSVHYTYECYFLWSWLCKLMGDAVRKSFWFSLLELFT